MALCDLHWDEFMWPAFTNKSPPTYQSTSVGWGLQALHTLCETENVLLDHLFMSVLRWLNQLQRPAAPSDQILLNTARSAAVNLNLESEIRLGESQALLQRLARRSPSEPLPLPSDKPLIQSFRTHYAYYSQRRVPGGKCYSTKQLSGLSSSFSFYSPSKFLIIKFNVCYLVLHRQKKVISFFIQI